MCCIVAALWLSACTESTPQDVPQPTPPAAETLDIDAGADADYTGAASASELELFIVSESDWQLTVSDTRAAVDWITPSATSGKAGKSSVTLAVSENMSQDDRVASIQLANSVSDMTFTYTQRHYDPANLTLSIDELEVGSEAVSQTFTLESALDWTLSSSDESFCTVLPIRGEAGEHTVTVSITGNTSTDRERTATLTARSGYETATVTVTQERRKPELNIDRGIKTLDDLCRFRDAVNAGESLAEWKYNGEINLLADIDLSYIDEWQGIGTPDNPFTDTFNGNGFSVKNMRITTGDDAYWNTRYGFFWTCEGGTIKNLVLEDAYSNIYGICGTCTPTQYPVKIINCTVSGYVKEAPFGWCFPAENDSGQTVQITDCTNRALTTYPICGGSAAVSSCANEGVYCYPYNLDYEFTDDGYKIDEELFDTITELGISSMEDFVDYVHTSLEDLYISVTGDYSNKSFNWNVNDNFVKLAAGSQSLEELRVSFSERSVYTTAAAQLERLSELIDLCEHIKLLECDLGNEFYSGGAPRLYLRNAKPELETLIVRSSRYGSYFSIALSADEMFPALKRIEYDGYYYSTLIPSVCKELVLSCRDSSLVIEHAQLEYIEVSNTDLRRLDVSKTNLGNSTYQYPLKCNGCGSYNKDPLTLVLKKGWKINGINQNVNYSYIDSDTVIEYAD